MPIIKAAGAALATLAAAALCTAHAQDYPAKPVSLVVSYSAGGNNDIRARQLSIPVGKLLGTTLIIENKPGASGNIGHEYVARAPRDGYVLGIGAMGPLSVNPAFMPKMGFDPLRDFEPVILIEKAPLVLVTRADKPLRNLRDVIAAGRAKESTLTVGNAGQGGAHHLSAEVLRQATGIAYTAVPYKGGGPATTALLAGEIDLMFEQTYAALPSIRAGRTRALGVTSDKRLPSLPEVPTFAELGYPQMVISNWLGVIAPKGTPKAVVAKLNAAFNQALAGAEMQEKIVGPGNQAGGGSPEEFGALIAAESKRWAALVASAKIKAD